MAGSSEHTVISLPEQKSDGVLQHNPSSFMQVFKKITNLSIPMALSYTFSFEVFISTVLLGHLSQNEADTASTALIASTMNTLVILGFSPLFAMSITASNKLGKLREKLAQLSVSNDQQVEIDKLRRGVKSVYLNGLIISAASSPIIFALMFFSKAIFVNTLHQDSAVATVAQDFLRTYAIAVPALMLRMSAEQIMFSFQKAHPAMVIGLVNLAVGTGLAAWLSIGGLGVSAMGAKGIAIGFAVEAYLTAIAYALYTFFSKDLREFEFYNLFSVLKGNLKRLNKLLKMSRFISFSVANEIVMSLMVGVLAGIIGIQEQAAMSYVMEFVFFIFIALSAFGQACCQEVSRELGARNFTEANRVGMYGVITTFAWILPIPVVCSIYPDVLTMVAQNRSPAIHALLQSLVPIISAGVIVDAVRYNILQQLRSLTDVKGSTVVSVAGLSLGMLASFLFGLNVFGLSNSVRLEGVAAGYTGGIVVAAAGLLWRFVHRIQPATMATISARGPEKNVSINECSDTPSLWNRATAFFGWNAKKELSQDEASALLAEQKVNRYS